MDAVHPVLSKCLAGQYSTRWEHTATLQATCYENPYEVVIKTKKEKKSIGAESPPPRWPVGEREEKGRGEGCYRDKLGLQ
jgi:hypothetical protein